MWHLLTNLITVRRRTAALLSPASAALTMTWDRQPVRESVVELHVEGDGTAGTGTLTVTGTSSGVATTETVTATGPGYYRTSHAWTALAGLTTSGLSNEAAVPTVEARAVGRDGSPAEALYVLRSGWPAAVLPGGTQGGGLRAGSWPNGPATGRVAESESSAVIAYDETWQPRRGDLITDDTGADWEIVGRPRLAGTDMVRHWDVRLKQHDSE